MKCIRNNWINQKDPAQTPTFPDLTDLSIVRNAYFKVLKELYENEKNSLVKLAPSLSQKAVNPSNTDRQSVPLMLSVFNDKTTCALSIFATKPGCCSAAINDTIIY